MAQAERSAANEDLAQIASPFARFAPKFPGEYWRALEPRACLSDRIRRGAHASWFSRRADPGRIRRQRTEHDGRGGDHGGDPGVGLQRRGLPAQMYTMGTLLRHGSAAQKARWLPAIASGELRLQAFGVTEPTSGSDTLNLRTTA